MSLLWDLPRATRWPGSRVAKFRVVPSSSPNLSASFTSKENSFSPHALSSNIRTLLIIGFGFSYSFIAAFILLFYRLESATPFIFWKIQHGSRAKRMSPTILTDQLPCKANWFVTLMRLASDRGLVQIIESPCKYGFAATVSGNFSSCITNSLTPRNLYLAPVLRLSTKAVSSSLDFAASSTCLSFLTWVTLQFSGSTANPYPA